MRGRTIFVSLLAMALVAWFLRHADLASVWGYVRTARIEYLVLALLCVAATYWVRAVRWQYLLAPIGPTRFRTAFRTTVIGFAALTLLPLRAGDVLRPYLLARQEGLRATSAFATIVMERVLDLMTVLALLAFYVWVADSATLPPALRQPIEAAAWVAAGLVAGLMVAMWLLASNPERIGTFVLAATRVLPTGLAARLAHVASTFSAGFAVARQPRALFLSVCWSVPLWLLIAAEVWAVSVAIGVTLPFIGAFLIQALLVIGVAVPTPGAVGSYHEAYRIGVTTFFGAPNDRAVAAAIVVHAIAFVPVVLAGIIFMAQDGLSMRRLRELAGDAHDREAGHTDEVSLLRSSGR
jgi:glycosyltransferase 2 family protein